MKFTSSTAVLILTAILWIVLMLILIFGILTNQDKEAPNFNPNVPIPQPNPVCNVTGVNQKVSSLPYVRTLPYSDGTPYQTNEPGLINIQHPVPKLTRLRSLTNTISPNHWLGSAMYGVDNLISCYPYLLSIKDEGLSWGWPGPGQLIETCNQTPCQIGQEQLIFTSSTGTNNLLNFGCLNQQFSACDIVNVDAFCATINWQYTNRNSQLTTAFQAVICQGCPYLTIFNLSLPMTISNITSLQKVSYGYLINNQYVLFLPVGVTLIQQHEDIYQLPSLQGTLRIAYYHDSNELNLLIDNNQLIPLESQVNVNTSTNNNQVNVNIEYLFKYANTGTAMMCKLPHQKLTNYTVLAQYSHPILGPYQLITTSDNNWHISETITDYSLNYPAISNSNLLTVYQADVSNVLSLPFPAEPVQYLMWLGSLANLIVIGKALSQDVSDIVKLLATELNKFTVNNGILTNNIAFTYDQEWGGTVSNLGITTCDGLTDQGNAFYQNHIGHHGYLLYAYAVAADNGVVINQNVAMYFVRSILNVSTDDKYFPLWRHKNWYLGYSLGTGLEPIPIKTTENISEIVTGYYAGYLLGKIINNQELMSWSAAMLATEISSAQTNFQFGSTNSISVNDHFVQGTITSRGDNYYAYITDNDQMFPQKNAAMTIPMVKPILGYSIDYINLQWASIFRPYVTGGLASPVEMETLCYGSVIAANSSNYNSIIDRIVDNRNNPLPYGATWSSVVYWILTVYG